MLKVIRKLVRPARLVGVRLHSEGEDARPEWREPESEDEVLVSTDDDDDDDRYKLHRHVNITYITRDDQEHHVRGKVGDNVLYLAHRFGIEMEGACEASLACTTCHVYVLDDSLEKIPEATEREEDLLDLAPFLKENSRLGCQIILTKQLEGLRVRLPIATRNFYVDGHVPQPH